jgi:hypothetical protein
VKNADTPEVLAVVPLPSAEERRRRETMLARVTVTTLLRICEVFKIHADQLVRGIDSLTLLAR